MRGTCVIIEPQAPLPTRTEKILKRRLITRGRDNQACPVGYRCVELARLQPFALPWGFTYGLQAFVALRMSKA